MCHEPAWDMNENTGVAKFWQCEKVWTHNTQKWTENQPYRASEVTLTVLSCVTVATALALSAPHGYLLWYCRHTTQCQQTLLKGLRSIHAMDLSALTVLSVLRGTNTWIMRNKKYFIFSYRHVSIRSLYLWIAVLECLILKIAACDVGLSLMKKLFSEFWLEIRTEFLIISKWSQHIFPFLFTMHLYKWCPWRCHS